MSRMLMSLSALLLTGALALTSSDAEARGRRVVVTVAPPVVSVPAPVSVTVAPASVWVPSYTVWDARLGRHVVVAGHWRAAQPDMVWVPGQWVRHGRSRTWMEGHWTVR